MANPIQDAYKDKGFQGVSPDTAKYIFWGTDANFDSTLGEKEKNLVIEYLEDGSSFWKHYKVHHPFLVKGYKFKAGRRYHRRFQALGFTPEHADLVSFVDVCGYSENQKFDSTGNSPTTHLKSLIGKCFSSGKINFMPISVLKELAKYLHHDYTCLPFSESTKNGLCELAEYKLDNKDEIPVFIGDAFASIRHFHFSSTFFSNCRAHLLRNALLALEDKHFEKATPSNNLLIL